MLMLSQLKWKKLVSILKSSAPGLAETLIKSLGADETEINQYKQSLQDEIDEHDDSDYGCGICAPSETSK